MSKFIKEALFFFFSHQNWFSSMLTRILTVYLTHEISLKCPPSHCMSVYVCFLFLQKDELVFEVGVRFYDTATDSLNPPNVNKITCMKQD